MMTCRSALSILGALALSFSSTSSAGIALEPGVSGPEVPLKANWIWHPLQPGADTYNQTIVARRVLKLRDPDKATMRITADTFYRLIINGEWVNDGPCRSWPEHFQYDVLDVSPYLRDGENVIEVIARFYGTGDFHHVPKEPGLLVQLDVTLKNGKALSFVTDSSWQTAEAKAWVSNTPKVSIQMEPAEWHDARLDQRTFTKAAVRYTTSQGPWKDLNPRDVALLTRNPFPLKSFIDARVVKTPGTNFSLPAARLLHPGVIEANRNVSVGCGMATVLVLEKPSTVAIEDDGFDFSIDGQKGKDGRFELSAGRHVLLAFTRDATSHRKEQTLRIVTPENPQLQNPLQNNHENPWCFIRFPELMFATNDMFWRSSAPEMKPIVHKSEAYKKRSAGLLREVTTEAAFNEKIKASAELMSFNAMFLKDSVPDTWRREVIGSARSLVKNPGALMHETAACTIVEPPAEGSVELLYDLGEQSCGYYDFDLTASAGVVVDIVGVEYITPDNRVQWSNGNRNGLRYITREGQNKFTSLKRRSGRYLFITLGNVSSPVKIRHLGLIESTYPVNAIGSFACSDERLTRIWNISARTLKLCMEDTFTDCPLYEQTHWVGDARNESLFGYTVFGAEDIGRRCARQTAQSLERYPIVGCQVPSGWDCMLPAWSFLWGISTWDYYWHTADARFLREMHPAVIQNLKGAESYIDKSGLFSAPFWNFFDWTAIDQNQDAVLHNSMLMVGAIDAALKSEEKLGCKEHDTWLRDMRARLVTGVNALWDPVKGGYPDSIRADGKPSPTTSQHTSFLSVLYDIVDKSNVDQARRNIIDPPQGMVKIGSPFAALYLYEALEKLGLESEIVKQTYANYLPMLEADATTVWESFPSGTTGRSGFPTRSHCHAWSSAPLYFLNRIIVGVKSTSAGWAEAILSPQPGDLKWARGTIATPHGPIHVSWEIKDNRMSIHFDAPENVKIQFRRNDSIKDLAVSLNGNEM